MKSISWKALLPLIVFGGLVAIFAIGLTLKPHDLPSQFIDKPLPAFELESVYEDQPPLRSEELKGEITLLNVFGSWCVACLVEHPFLMELKATEDIQTIPTS